MRSLLVISAVAFALSACHADRDEHPASTIVVPSQSYVAPPPSSSTTSYSTSTTTTTCTPGMLQGC